MVYAKFLARMRRFARLIPTHSHTRHTFHSGWTGSTLAYWTAIPTLNIIQLGERHFKLKLNQHLNFATIIMIVATEGLRTLLVY